MGGKATKTAKRPRARPASPSAKRSRSPRDAAWKRLRLVIAEHIERVGWSVLYVAAGSYEGSTSLCYTIGLTGKGLPELIVLGLDQSTAHWVLNDVAALAVGGQALTPGGVIVIDAGHLPLKVANFDDREPLILAAIRYYRAEPDRRVSAVQLVWAVDGAFPGEPGYPYGKHVQAVAAPKGADFKRRAAPSRPRRGA